MSCNESLQGSTNPKQMYIKEKLDGCAPNVFAADCYSLEISQAPALRKIRNIRNNHPPLACHRPGSQPASPSFSHSPLLPT